MSLQPRPYNGLQDFCIMTSILAVGRKTTNRPYYVHTGDLSWWMYYTDLDDTQWSEYIHIWDRDGHPCGWSLMDPDWYSFDVYLLPEMRGTKGETYILDWTIHRLTKAVRRIGGRQIRTVWVSEKDSRRIELLESRGFVQDEHFMWYLEHPLNAHIPPLNLPNDYVVRPVQGETDIRQRAAASHNAFGSTRQFEEYWPRYQRFMRSPVYNSNFDLVTESPDGQFASFCIIWPDPINHIGLFEPVGTHSDFQRQGLGKAVVTAGLHQLKAYGMDRAMVCAQDDNPPALQLYQAVGFVKKYKLLTFIKSI